MKSYVLCLILGLLLLSNVFFATNRVVNGTGAACTADLSYYSTIQEAIDASAEGDLITVCQNSTTGYVEDVQVNKTGLRLIGNESYVFIPSVSSGTAYSMYINASNVLIQNFEMTKADANKCVIVDHSNNVTFSGMKLRDCSYAIYVQDNTNNTIVSSSLFNSSSNYGIHTSG